MFISKKIKNIISTVITYICLLGIVITSTLIYDENKDLKNDNDVLINKIGTIQVYYNDLETQYNALKNDLSAVKAYYSGDYKISYYDSCVECCGKTDGITASGTTARAGVTVAADTSKLPFGTKVYIEGIGFRTVQDRGGAIKGNKLDVYINDCNGEMPYNQQNLKVWVIVE